MLFLGLFPVLLLSTIGDISNMINNSHNSSYPIETSYMLSAEGFGSEEYFNNSFRFSSAFDKNFLVFEIENTYTLDERGSMGMTREQAYLDACFHECNIQPYCNGVFYRIRTNFNLCSGLSYLGKIAQTHVRSLSYTKTRRHTIYDPKHTLYGYVLNDGEVNNYSLVFLDNNLNGLLDGNEEFIHTDIDGFYQFQNLMYNVYPVNHKLPEIVTNLDTCTALQPRYNGSFVVGDCDSVFGCHPSGFPDTVYEYFDSSRGGLDGLELGYPHGGLIDDLVRNDGVPMSNKLININITNVLGNNTKWSLILSENSHVSLGFYHDYILNNGDNSLIVYFLYEVNAEDWLRVNISENNRDWYYIGDITESNNVLQLGHVEEVSVVRSVRLIGASSNGRTRGFPFVSLFANHSKIERYLNGYFIQLSALQGNSVNFTNVCELRTTYPSAVTTTITTSTTTITTSTTTITTSTTTITTTITTTSTTTITTSTTTNLLQPTSGNDKLPIGKSSVLSTTNIVIIAVCSSVGLVLIVSGIVIGVNRARIKRRIREAFNERNVTNSFQNPLYISPLTLTTDFQTGVSQLIHQKSFDGTGNRGLTLDDSRI